MYFVCSTISISSLDTTKYQKIYYYQKTKSDLPQSYWWPGGRFSLNDTVFFMTSHLP